MRTLKPAAPALPAITTELLLSLYQHRLLTTSQIHQMHMHGRSGRRTEQILATLVERGLTAFVRPNRHTPRLHYLTPQGIHAAELIPTRAETRRKLITPEQAAGPLWQHTIAVNQAGIAFMHTARQRGDDFGPFAWRHEIAHHAPTPGHPRNELLISDALLTYQASGPDGRLTYHYRLLELDRATTPTNTLAAKLTRYTHLHNHTTPNGQPAWQTRYPIFPGILAILTGQPRPTLQRRAQTVLTLCQNDSQLIRTPQVRISLALLEDLTAHGPYGRIWHQPQDPTRPLDWLGKGR